MKPDKARPLWVLLVENDPTDLERLKLSLAHERAGNIELD